MYVETLADYDFEYCQAFEDRKAGLITQEEFEAITGLGDADRPDHEVRSTRGEIEVEFEVPEDE